MDVNCSRVAVIAFMRISWNTVGTIIERVEKDLDINPNARFDNLVRIGVDETSYRKGHKYITTVVNHDTGNVIWVAKGHGKTIFEQFFKLLTATTMERLPHMLFKKCILRGLLVQYFIY